ncbi:L-seryl-tRNA(Sec) selenium transferase [Desulforamulus reducens MI-1]|uniref:L-seryl-tRNA(Sec) selenium transferase n=1 Tax=Desulforamulus reducens (strain ATCC BAA-1160 / DSM 100696 / MI-1) TaxID=349161 RepID=A4J6J8_DESRM|nr:L-seryl-tRNA(Sec) selenium transferase [Desulforamulus reducens]ABO50701.1 L-seryl-tRNA(Sec) selenium transferase [Desulforamulus reducens MI-1]
MELQKNKDLLRELPKVDQIIKNPAIDKLLDTYPRTLVVEAVRNSIDSIRKGILNGQFYQIDKMQEMVIQGVVDLLEKETRPNLRKVINATGVVLHTNLGRALLSKSARKAVDAVTSSFCNLEINLESGKRGSRYEPVEELITRLTGAEAALVVNNNASAVLLALGTLAKGKEVIVSRGQLVEIGGSFRIPEVMEQSGAILVEVGATNKTHPWDYRNGISENTALLLHVHTSNYRIVGFTRETTVEELVAIGKEGNIPVMSDLGSGFLVELSQFGLPKEPSVQETVAAGADVITFSGDKLLGGPQAGIIVGKRHWIEKMKKNPLTRAVRINKFTVAALEATLREYLDEQGVLKNIPTLRMLTEPTEEIRSRARELEKKLRMLLKVKVDIEVIGGTSQVGGGSMPTAEMATYILACVPENLSVDELAVNLRMSEPAVVARVQDGKYQVDLRTVQFEEIDMLATVMAKVLNSGEVSRR